MFIGTAQSKDLAPSGANQNSGTIATAGKRDCAPTELRVKERIHTINISPYWGEATNNVLALPT